MDCTTINWYFFVHISFLFCSSSDCITAWYFQLVNVLLLLRVLHPWIKYYRFWFMFYHRLIISLFPSFHRSLRFSSIDYASNLRVPCTLIVPRSLLDNFISGFLWLLGALQPLVTHCSKNIPPYLNHFYFSCCIVVL